MVELLAYNEKVSGSSPLLFKKLLIIVRVEQWLAHWAHDPEVVGSSPASDKK